MRRRELLIVLSILLASTAFSESPKYTTARLERISKYLKLDRTDTLSIGSNIFFSKIKAPLIIRKNEHNEIEHIGIKLFSEKIRNTYSSPIYDFLERYLLEKNLYPVNSEENVRLNMENVKFEIGDPYTALEIDSTYEFVNSYDELKRYRVSWRNMGINKLVISFDMDYQLMTGSTEIELENNLILTLHRGVCKKNNSLVSTTFPESGTEYISKGDCFLSPNIRNDRYYNKIKGKWQLVSSEKRLQHSLSNMMLDPNISNLIESRLVIDRYGGIVDTLIIPFRNIVDFCLNDGCVSYFGLKEKKNSEYAGTLFYVNKQGGYLHMLSIQVPTNIISNPEKSIIWGRLYAYIPLFNASDYIIDPQSYKKLK